MKKANKIRVGPAGWSYTDWEKVVYPPHGSKFDHLAYLSEFFDTIEINSPFYRIPPSTHAKSWVRRVAANPDFLFTTKVFRGFTHEKAELADADVTAFRNYLDPLMEANRLGAILLQFPWSFKNTPESCDKLEALFASFAEYPKALEVRHSTFQKEEFYTFLDEHRVSWVNVDQPLFNDSVKPADIATGPIAYARFHGRNYEKWFAHEEAWERYNYLYSEEELEPWVKRIEGLAKSRDTFVVTNNHFRGQAIVNAGDIRESLGLENKMPPQLREVYGDRIKGAMSDER
ncbi:MAG TPA: DUF72 domain-containing protein [Thermoanaerobaculia bacterium]|nr:DUF72 domain-containing protein [Thermoanaerobaculia bacterium]